MATNPPISNTLLSLPEYLDITIVYLVIGLLLAMIIGMVICFQKSKRYVEEQVRSCFGTRV